MGVAYGFDPQTPPFAAICSRDLDQDAVLDRAIPSFDMQFASIPVPAAIILSRCTLTEYFDRTRGQNDVDLAHVAPQRGGNLNGALHDDLLSGRVVCVTG